MNFLQNIKNIFINLVVIFSTLACAESEFKNYNSFYVEDNAIVSGQTLEIKTYNGDFINNKIKISVIDDNENKIETYSYRILSQSLLINRFMTKKASLNSRYYLLIEDNLKKQIINLDIKPSIFIENICATKDCNTMSGNIVHGVSNIIKVSAFKIQPVKFVYNITTPYQEITKTNEYNSPVDNDWISDIILKDVPDDISYYVSLLRITAYDLDNNYAETLIPVKVVRPLTIKHFGKHELAEVYEPVPVTGCIPGSVGNNVQYSESESETRQNSVSITINQNWSDSFTSNTTQTISEGISVDETLSTVNSSSMSNSETQSESFSNTTSESESNNISYSTNDGESWSWSLGESSSSTEGQSQTEGDNTSVNGSTTVGVSGEGSLPFIAKASGKVEVSAGISRGWNSSNSNSSSETSGESRGYTTSGSSQEGRTFGSVQNDARSHSLSGAYILSNTTSNSISESTSLSSGRVWNMSEGISSGKVVTEGSGESISQTIVNSSTSSTTFSYSGYIPRGRFGIFFRQTSRYVKLSEIITYDLNGFPSHAGFIMMNTWAWAPELSVGQSCQEAIVSSMPSAECLIPPCGE